MAKAQTLNSSHARSPIDLSPFQLYNDDLTDLITRQCKTELTVLAFVISYNYLLCNKKRIYCKTKFIIRLRNFSFPK